MIDKTGPKISSCAIVILLSTLLPLWSLQVSKTCASKCRLAKGNFFHASIPVKLAKWFLVLHMQCLTLVVVPCAQATRSLACLVKLMRVCRMKTMQARIWCLVSATCYATEASKTCMVDRSHASSRVQSLAEQMDDKKLFFCLK